MSEFGMGNYLGETDTSTEETVGEVVNIDSGKKFVFPEQSPEEKTKWVREEALRYSLDLFKVIGSINTKPDVATDIILASAKKFENYINGVEAVEENGE